MDRRRILCFVILAAVLSWPSPASAQRKDGLTVYVVPKEAAEDRKDPMWRFVLSCEALQGQKDRPCFREPREVLKYFFGLPQKNQQAGVWIVFVSPMAAYSDQEKTKMEELKMAFAQKKIRLTLCGGRHELDWRRVEGLDPLPVRP